MAPIWGRTAVTQSRYTSVFYDKHIKAWLLIDKRCFWLEQVGKESHQVSCLVFWYVMWKWAQVMRTVVWIVVLVWGCCCCFGLVFLFVWVFQGFFGTRRKQRQKNSHLGYCSVLACGRGVPRCHLGACVCERGLRMLKFPTSWELAMHFSCKSSPQNGWYLFITQHSVIWERVIQYYRDMLSKRIDACVRSLGDLG